MNRKTYIFYSVYIPDDDREISYNIITSQVIRLISSGLYDSFDKIFVYLTANDISRTFVKNYIHELNKFEIIKDSHINQFEYPAIFDMIDKSKFEDFNCLYFHTKGSSRTSDYNEFQHRYWWRQCMEYYNIDKHEICLDHLNSGYDAVGCLWLMHGNNVQFSGNFFWTKSEYLRKNSKGSFNTDRRFHAETGLWKQNPKIKNLRSLRKHIEGNQLINFKDFIGIIE